MIHYQPLQFDITGKIAGLRGKITIAAWVFFPQKPAKGILFCLPGGSYSKAYFHLQVPNYPPDTYSFASAMAQQGWVILAIDHLGTGESGHPQQDLLTMERIAAANNAVVRQMQYYLLAKTLHGDMPMFSRPPIILGVGHSMGGMLALAQQAYHSAFDALVVLGWSNRKISFGETEQQLAEMTNAKGQEEPEEMARRAGLSHSLQEARQPFRPFFYLSDVPQAVIEADEALATNMPRGMLLDIDASQRVRTLAATKIDIPVFAGFGTTDVTDDLQAESQTYSSLAKVTTFRLPHSAHCHNFASTRRLLWDRIDEWGTDIVEASISRAS